MCETFLELIRDDRAQDTVEYGIALAVVGAVGSLAAVAIANVGQLWAVSQTAIHLVVLAV
jgi:hypothetical protein